MLNAAAAVGRLSIAWIDQRLERDGWMLLEQYADVTLSLTDATTVAVAKKRKITEIFGFDRDFEATGLLVMPLR